MAVVPTPPTIYDDVLPSSLLNQIRDAIKFLQRPPHAQVRQTSAQTLTNNIWTAITFDAEDIDDDIDAIGGHSTSSDISRFTARYPGWYQVSGAIGFDSNSTGVRGARWAVNGTGINAGGPILSTASGSITVVPAATEQVYLATNDYVELQGIQTSGANLNTNVLSTAQSTMVVCWKSI